jgi:3-hydroxyisobutyrate dehydrogenase-like beta-hydroxyacid dehydrogenase
MTRDDVVVGFVGLGIMGGRMAANLQKAGYKLVVHDLQRQAASHHLNAARPGQTIRAPSPATAT